jgi:hypothetical protein
MPIGSHKPSTPIGWFIALRESYPQWYVPSPRSEAHPRPWPRRFDPRRDPVFAHNELWIAEVEPARIFDLLVDAEGWPRYYDDCARVEIKSSPVATAARHMSGHGPLGITGAILKAAAVAPLSHLPASGTRRLRLGTKFRWETFSVVQHSEVTLYEPDRALGWTARSPGTRAYHRWFLLPEGHGTRVITEECQRGFVAWLDHHWMNPSLHATHQLWLEELRLKALGLRA